MNSKVHPAVAALVIALVVVAIATWMWGTGAAASLGGPSELRQSPSGHLFIQMQNQLLEHDASGEFIARHDLSELGVDTVLGAVDFFSNGDLLLRRGPDPRSVLDNIRAYMRQTNEHTLETSEPGSGLYRCNLSTGECELFGKSPIDFKATYGLFIDRSTDDVYVSDTSRHLVRKYSASGEQSAEPAAGFKFPNQPLMHDGQLLIADTNLHRIRVIDPATANFGSELASHLVITESSRQAGHTWPSHFARVGDKWWINNLSLEMDNGGIYVFDDGWNFLKRISLPADADPIAIQPFNGEVLISDWYNDRIYRVTVEGELAGEISSAGLTSLIDESKSARRGYLMYAYIGVGAIVMTIVVLLLIGVTADKSDYSKQKPAATSDGAIENYDEMLWFKPDPETIRKLTSAERYAGAGLFVITGLFVYAIAMLDNDRFIGMSVAALAGFAVVYALIIKLNRINTGTAIGLCRNQLTIRDHTGDESTCDVDDVVYDQYTIASGDKAVSIGTSQIGFYDRADIDARLMPRLAGATQISTVKMQAELIRMRHPQGLVTVLALLIFVAAATWTLLHEGM